MKKQSEKKLKISKAASWWTEERVAIIRGMLERGDSQQSIASWFGGEINSGRINEIAKRSVGWVKKYDHVKPASRNELPPPGPYPAGYKANRALVILETVLDKLEQRIKFDEAAMGAVTRAIKALKDPGDDQ